MLLTVRISAPPGSDNTGIQHELGVGVKVFFSLIHLFSHPFLIFFTLTYLLEPLGELF